MNTIRTFKDAIFRFRGSRFLYQSLVGKRSWDRISLRMIPYRDVPIILNSYNRLSCLKQMVDWFGDAGYRRIIILDNRSTYEPLLAYLHELERTTSQVEVIHLGKNVGHLALWKSNILARLGITTEFVYSDPDVVPIAECPGNLIETLQQILQAEPDIAKAGPALRTDDLPESFQPREAVKTWESQFWLRPVDDERFLGAIDTTLALYRPFAEFDVAAAAIRTGWPLVASHRGWYANTLAPSEEDVFYKNAATGQISTWGGRDTNERFLNHEKPEGNFLYVSPNRMAVPGFTTISPSDWRMALAAIPDGSLNGIYVGRALNETQDAEEMIAQLCRAANRGATLVLRLTEARLDSGVCKGRIGGKEIAVGELAGWKVARIAMVPGREAILHCRPLETSIAPCIVTTSRSRLDPFLGFAGRAES